MGKTAVLTLIAATLAGCEAAKDTAQNQVGNDFPAAQEQANLDQAIEPGEPGGLPDDRNLVEEGPIDPKSGQGAGQVLQSYAALIEQGRLAEARVLGNGLSDEAIAKYSEIHAEIGAPGPVEGAAGSAYVDLPVRFYGKTKSGSSFSSVGTATLRRVNDVPGSTDEQRRWHIYRIDVQPPL